MTVTFSPPLNLRSTRPWVTFAHLRGSGRRVTVGGQWVAVDPRARAEWHVVRVNQLVVVKVVDKRNYELSTDVASSPDEFQLLEIQGGPGVERVLVSDGSRYWQEEVRDFIDRPRNITELKKRLFDEQRMIRHRESIVWRLRAEEDVAGMLVALEDGTRSTLRDLCGSPQAEFAHAVKFSDERETACTTSVTVPLHTLQRLLYFALLWQEADPEGWRRHVTRVLA